MVWRGFKKFCAVMCVFCVRQWVLVMKVLLYVVVGAFWCRNYWFYRPHKDFIPSLIQFDSMFLCFGPWILHFGRLPTDLVKTYEGLKQLVLPCHGLKLTDLQSKAFGRSRIKKVYVAKFRHQFGTALRLPMSMPLSVTWRGSWRWFGWFLDFWTHIGIGVS